jgi:CheY-like chemotaxis protein
MGTTLLLADDSITIQKVVGIIFANEDYELVVVDNGIAALEKAKEKRPDIMLVDALMPGKSGYEVCEEVRRDPCLKDVPLLLLVGAFEPFDEVRAKNSGADDHITKPFESQSLIDKVKELVELGVSRTAAAPAPAEQVPPETVTPAVEASVQPAEEVSANLIDSFRGFVHLGGEAVQPVAVEPAVSEEAAEPAAPPVTPEPEGVILLSSVDIIEAGPEDDPWGTFGEDVTEGETIQFGEILDGEESPGLSDTVEEIEPFTLLDEEFSPMAVETAEFPHETAAEASHVPSWQDTPVSETLPESAGFASFSPEEPPVSERVSQCISLGEFPVHAETVPEPAVEELSVGEASEPVGLPPEEIDLPFAPEEDYVSVSEALAVPQEIPEPAAVRLTEPSVVTAGETSVTITEEQLAAAISRISREVIERIAWDVVPDLAETIIKEEIRKIKEGMLR